MVQLLAPIPIAFSEEGPPLPTEFRQFGGALFDSRELFMHVYQNPADIPLTIKWGEELFHNFMKSKGQPPQVSKFPWEQ